MTPVSPDLNALRHTFQSGITRSHAFRQQQLRALARALQAREKAIYEALGNDLQKNPEEAWVTENGFVLAEIHHTLRCLQKWMEPEPVHTNFLNLPASSKIYQEPKGVVLIIGPWNYPLQLLLTPLIGAIAAGNCVVIKPSEFAPATAALIQEIIAACFPADYIVCLQGEGAAMIPPLIRSFRFDHIFYTGSTAVGKLIYQLAAEQLIPVTLELGGKSPCIIEADANIRVAARRIVQTKFSNAGQMCVAPDYVLVHQSIKAALVEELVHWIQKFYGDAMESSGYYGKIVNEKQFDRLLGYLSQGRLIFGGRHDRSRLFIEPTLMDQVNSNDPVMQEEIFGPILPVLSFENPEAARNIILRHPDPLALYVFTRDMRKAENWLQSIPSGGACINNPSWHLTNPNLPFGGRGNSGIGSYHGKNSFDAFSHQKAVMRTPNWFDPAIKYPPLKGKLSIFKRIIR
ncbi:MAG TPA: aldehyde dehydrogenase [Sediminibacterium sp.]|nr:aldehyde dehydrogenase [Sediminibacterium sp.]